jgi:hypothetical protein
MGTLRTPVLCLIGGMFVIYFSVVTYAIHFGRDVKASLKFPFGAFSFETKVADDHEEKYVK